MECQVDRQVVTNRIFIEFGPVCVLRILVRKSVVNVDPIRIQGIFLKQTSCRPVILAEQFRPSFNHSLFDFYPPFLPAIPMTGWWASVVPLCALRYGSWVSMAM